VCAGNPCFRREVFLGSGGGGVELLRPGGLAWKRGCACDTGGRLQVRTKRKPIRDRVPPLETGRKSGKNGERCRDKGDESKPFEGRGPRAGGGVFFVRRLADHR